MCAYALHTPLWPCPPAVQRARRCVQAKAAPSKTQAIAVSKTTRPAPGVDSLQVELEVLTALRGARGRGKDGLSAEQLEQLNAAIEKLEADGGVQDPALSPALDGRWRLLYTSRPGSASPIQRTFTGVEAFSVFQEVELDGEEARVNNVVDFGLRIGYLKVEAEASTDARPLRGFTPREGAGLSLFGKSFNYPAARPNMRIDFQFDRAAFYFKFLPFTLPYPVPFRALGDERKGWLDVTYMNADGTFRLSRGNKGTLFVLVKDVPIKERLAKAIERGDEQMILTLIQLLQQDSPIQAPARSPAVGGTWRLVWSQQAEDASALQKFGSQQADSFQIIDEQTGALQNLVLLAPWLRISAQAECSPASDTRTEVFIQDAGIYLGPLKLPVPIGRGGGNPGYVDWLYLDDALRITRGSKGSLFVHRKELDADQQEG